MSPGSGPDLERPDPQHHLFQILLPLWADVGRDRRHGGFHNRLTHSLEPLDPGSKRMLVQSRQLWVFSRAAVETDDGEFRRVAEEQFEFYLGRCRDRAHGGWYLTLEDGGEPLDRTKDTYNHAFALLALAAYHELTSDASALDEIAHTLEVLETKLRDPGVAGFFDAASEIWEPLCGLRRQNPHMHLLEAFLALYESTRDAAHLARALEMIELFRSVFCDTKRGLLFEYFDESWSRAPSPDGDRLEPGHHFEWSWLLSEYARLSGDQSVLPAARALFDFAVEFGVDREHEGVFAEVDPDGQVLLDTKRIWPQTEYLRAATLFAPERVPKLLQHCFNRYMNPQTGAWFEQTDAPGSITSTALNASSLYHIYGALTQTTPPPQSP